MPWETDGQRWHTRDRVTTEGKPCRWEGAILTGWTSSSMSWALSATRLEPAHRRRDRRSKQEPGLVPARHDRQEWLVRLVFRVGKNAFKSADLVRRLGIKPLNDTPGLEVYSRGARVGDQPQGPLAVGDGAGASPQRDRHARFSRVPERGGGVVPR